VHCCTLSPVGEPTYSEHSANFPDLPLASQFLPTMEQDATFSHSKTDPIAVPVESVPVWQKHRQYGRPGLYFDAAKVAVDDPTSTASPRINTTRIFTMRCLLVNGVVSIAFLLL
jgi:hypothetical protein